jgi:hypothetical protein
MAAGQEACASLQGHWTEQDLPEKRVGRERERERKKSHAGQNILMVKLKMKQLFLLYV